MRSGIVLAGGKGERMGGAYKPLVPFRGRPLLAWALDAVAPLVEDVIVAHGPPTNAFLLQPHMPPHARLVADDGRGPHGGLLAAARAANGSLLLVAPADAPHLRPTAYEILLRAADGRDGAVFLQESHVQALIAVYRKDALLRALPEAPSVKAAVGKMDVARIDAGLWAFLLSDVDSHSDLAAAEARDAR